MSDETLLVINGIGFPQVSGYGIKQTLSPIEGAGVIQRDINGNAVDLSQPQFFKYQTSLEASTMNVPEFNGLWPGQAILVDCISELCYLTASGSPDRDVVTGSERVVGDFTFYRPSLEMLVTSFSWQTDEWGAVVGWSLSAVEV